MRNSIVTNKTEASLEKSKQPGNAIWPTSEVLEILEDELAGVVRWRCACEKCDADNSEARNGPNEGSFGNKWEHGGTKCVDQECHDIVENIYQKLMPRFRSVALKTAQQMSSLSGQSQSTSLKSTIAPTTNWLPRRPPVATSAIHPATLIQPVIHDSRGTERFQAIMATK